MADEQRLTARVYGGVQGVGFRAFVLAEARALGLAGFARNGVDGSVEVVAEGRVEALRELERNLRRGPAGAVVTSVDARWSPATGEFRDFRVRS